EIEQAYGIDFAAYFAEELATLSAEGGLIEEGFVNVDDAAVTATELGSLFIRNVAMVFDRYRRAPSPTPTFSRTV
ncbi:MAG: coproporphyrinogen III oxidase, partial [Thermoleophilia bacterium]|nr:coproporphyrinogen III oxidase [Thermoleophilia bacterium]